MTGRFDISVVGRGLMGTAAARYLAQMGHRVALIGPSEPQNRATHDGPFGSHHDAGRITRGLAERLIGPASPCAQWRDTGNLRRY